MKHCESSSSLSKIPVLQGSTHKARPAPDFSKLHRRWEDRFHVGKAASKKPCTVTEEFDMTKPGTKFVHPINPVDETAVDFEGDRLALESILSNRGLSQRKVTGRTTIAGPMSTGKIHRKTCSSVGKRRILGELLCDPDQKLDSKSAKKCLKFAKSAAEVADVGFQKDDSALNSILSNTGIVPEPLHQPDRSTLAGPVSCNSKHQQSLYHVPKYDRVSMMDACTAYRNLMISKCLPPEKKKDCLSLKTDEGNKKQEDSANMMEGQPASCDRHTRFLSKPAVLPSPFGSTKVTPMRNSVYKKVEIHPTLTDYNCHEETEVETNAQVTPKRVPASETIQRSSARRVPYSSRSTSKKNVKWADILRDTSRGSPVIRKEKLKKALFTPLDKFEDDYKENECPKVDHTVKSGGQKQGDTCDSDTTQYKHISGETRLVAAVESESSLSSGTTDEEALCMTHRQFPVRSPIQKSSRPSQSNTAHGNKVTCTETTVTNDNEGGACSNRFGHGRSVETQNTTLAKRQQGQEIVSPLETTAVEFGHFYYSGTDIGTTDKRAENLAVHATLQKGGGIIAYHGSSQTLDKERRETQQNYNVGSRGGGAAATNQDNHLQLQAIKEQETENHISMAMHTDEGEDGGQTAEQTASTTGHIQPNKQDVVDRFVGRIKRTRKRQSIAELNESITESQAHLQSLEGEISRLHEGQGSRSEILEEKEVIQHETSNMNIMYQLELIHKKQEELMTLQKQLQDQLNTQVRGQGQIHTTPVIDCVNGNEATKGQSLTLQERCVETAREKTSNVGDEYNNNKTVEKSKVSSPEVCDQLQHDVEVPAGFVCASQLCEVSQKQDDIPCDWLQSETEVPTGFVCASQLCEVSQKQDDIQCSNVSVPKNASDVIAMETEVIPQRISSLWHRPLSLSVPASPLLSETCYRAQGTSIPTPETPVFLLPKTVVTPGTPGTPVTPSTPVCYFPRAIGPLTTPSSVTKCESLVTVVATPVRTPLALPGSTQSQSLSSNSTPAWTRPTTTDSYVNTPLDLSTNSSVFTVTKSEHKNALCCVSNVTDRSLDQSTVCKVGKPAVTRSAFSSVKGSPFKESTGSLSLKANVLSSPRGRERLEDTSLRRRIVCLRTNERYLEALLDDECALYACRVFLQPTFTGRGIVNPVARILTEGDDMHFVPIMEEGPCAINVRENSAFCCC